MVDDTEQDAVPGGLITLQPGNPADAAGHETTSPDGRHVLTREELAEKHHLSIGYLEGLYRDREANGHPEPAGQGAWDASTWRRWYDHVGTEGLESREDLRRRNTLGRSTLEKLYRDRETNGHPEPAKKVGNTLYWDPAVWDAWHQDYKAGQAWRTQVGRSGDPEDEITLSEAARVLDMDPTSITKYPERPPRHWPDPVRETETASGRTKRWYRRGDIWQYADLRERGGGGRPVGTAATAKARYPYDGDPRLDQARAAVKTCPGTSITRLAGELARDHGGAAGTWSHIVRSARQHPQD